MEINLHQQMNFKYFFLWVKSFAINFFMHMKLSSAHLKFKNKSTHDLRQFFNFKVKALCFVKIERRSRDRNISTTSWRSLFEETSRGISD